MLKKIFIKAVVCGFVLSALVLQGSLAAGAEGQAINDKFGKALIVYYSLSGNTKQLADLIQRYTNADIYVLETVHPYPPVPELYNYAKRELERGAWPLIKTDWPDFAAYDVVFVGGPVWWYTLPTPLISFLQQADFKGRPVIAFCSHGGNYGEYFTRFKQEARNARVLKGLEVYRPSYISGDYLKSKVMNWLSGLQLPAR